MPHLFYSISDNDSLSKLWKSFFWFKECSFSSELVKPLFYIFMVPAEDIDISSMTTFLLFHSLLIGSLLRNHSWWSSDGPYMMLEIKPRLPHERQLNFLSDLSNPMWPNFWSRVLNLQKISFLISRNNSGLLWWPKLFFFLWFSFVKWARDFSI